MFKTFFGWFQRLPYTNSLDLQNAKIVQGIIVGVLIVLTGSIGTPFLAPVDFAGALMILLVLLIIYILFLLSLYALRKGYLWQATSAVVWSLMSMFSVLLIGTGLFDSGALLVAYSVPITIAGLLLNRRMMIWCVSAGLLSLIFVALLHIGMPEIIGWAGPEGANYGGVIGGFIAVIIVLALIVDRVGMSLRTALDTSIQQQKQLSTLTASLEETVQERTQQLEQTLAELQTRNIEQQELLEANLQQRQQIRALSVPVLPVGAHKLVLPLIGELDQERMNEVRRQVLEAVQLGGIQYMIFDITGLSILDGEMASQLIRLAHAVRLLGAKAILVGVRPEVAQSLVSSDIELEMFRTYATLENALTRIAT